MSNVSPLAYRFAKLAETLHDSNAPPEYSALAFMHATLRHPEWAQAVLAVCTDKAEREKADELAAEIVRYLHVEVID